MIEPGLLGSQERVAITPRVARYDIVDHLAPAESAEPSQKNDPMDRTESADPIDATDNTEPIEPIDRTDPRDPMLSTESVDHNDKRDAAMTQS